MALINCPDCGKEISNKAVSCPNCGRPIRNRKKTDPTPNTTPTAGKSGTVFITLGIISLIFNFFYLMITAGDELADRAFYLTRGYHTDFYLGYVLISKGTWIVGIILLLIGIVIKIVYSIKS